MAKEGAFVDGEQMRIARKRRGLSQTQLGELIGITGAAVSCIERGRHGVSQDVKQKLADVLRINGVVLNVPMLTQAEQEAIDMAGQLYTLIAQQIIEHGPNRDGDLRELRRPIHEIQKTIMAQAAARAYPHQYRLLGEETKENT